MSRNELLGEIGLIESHSMLGSKLSCPTLDMSLHDNQGQSGFWQRNQLCLHSDLATQHLYSSGRPFHEYTMHSTCQGLCCP